MAFLANLIERTHEWRVLFWIVMVPICIFLGWHVSLFVLFLYSTYANIGGDLAAWQGRKAREEAAGD